MSHALVSHAVGIEILDEAGGRMRTRYAVLFGRNDGIVVQDEIEIGHSADATPADIQTAIIAACRSKGGDHGLAIQANRVFINLVGKGA